MNSVLSGEPARVTAPESPDLLQVGRPAGMKLGRTQAGSAWAVGYTPQRVVSVWLGKPDGSAWQASLDPGLAAGLWSALMQWSARGEPSQGWTPPAGVSVVKVCDPSGLLPTPQCPSVVDEVFLSGSEPTHTDTFYRAFQVNRETGRLATVFTPSQSVEEKIFPVYPADALDWARQAGLPTPPDRYDDIPPQQVLADAAVKAPAMFAAVGGKVELRGTAGGEDFASYRVEIGAGLAPTTWTQLGGEITTPVTGGLLATWDTSGKNGLYAVRLSVVHRDQRVDTATIAVTVDNDSPAASIIYPIPGEAFHFPGEKVISLQVKVEDAVGIDRVEWWVDGRLAKVVTQAPYSMPWTADGTGEHKTVAKVYDRAGNAAESAPVTFSFGN
jgi:membrane carboxypeptidase/penicillin-binding protein PbpC